MATAQTLRETKDILDQMHGSDIPPKRNDVIQIDPEQSIRFGRCFAIVTKVFEREVECSVWIPGNADPKASPGVRIEHGHYAMIGRARWYG